MNHTAADNRVHYDEGTQCLLSLFVLLTFVVPSGAINFFFLTPKTPQFIL